MKKILPSFIALSLLLLQACGGANHWDGLKETLSVTGSGASSLALTEIYVCGATGDDILGDGSQAAPFATIERGRDEAVALGLGEVRVAEGIYNENINLIEGVSLYGGYESAGWTRDTAAHITTIDGDTASAIIADTPPVTAATVVDGFILQRSLGGGAVVTITNTSPTISNNDISATGNGIECTGSSAVISDNSINSGATAIKCNTYTGTMENNTITATNTGIFWTSSRGRISGGTISANTGISLFPNNPADMIEIDNITITAINIGIESDTCNLNIHNNIISSGAGALNYALQINERVAEIHDNTINGGGGTDSWGIYMLNTDAGTRIYNNVIDGGSGATSYGIFASSAAAFTSIFNNTINGGNGMGSTTYGIRNQSIDSIIYNNVITGGTDDTQNTHGIYCQGFSSPQIYNNAIDGGHASADTSYGIYINNNATPLICNNIIHISGVTTVEGYGVYEFDNTCNPVELRNNNIFNCTNGLYHDTSPGLPDDLMMDFQLNDEGLTNQGGAGTADGNVVEVVSMDAQGRRTGVWPMAVIGNGLNGLAEGWGFDFDRDGILRTTAGVPPLSWSMGAYEYDAL